MRTSFQEVEIEVHQGRDNWFWTVFDERGGELEKGQAADQAIALRHARRCALLVRLGFGKPPRP